MELVQLLIAEAILFILIIAICMYLLCCATSVGSARCVAGAHDVEPGWLDDDPMPIAPPLVLVENPREDSFALAAHA